MNDITKLNIGEEYIIYKDDFSIASCKKNSSDEKFLTLYFKKNNLYFETENCYNPFQEVAEYIFQNDFIYEVALSEDGLFINFLKEYINKNSITEICFESFQKNGYVVVYIFKKMFFDEKQVKAYTLERNYTLPTTQIAMSDVNVELGKASNSQNDLNNVDVRALANKTSGQISMADLRGKSAGTNNKWFDGKLTLHSSFSEEWNYDEYLDYMYSNHSVFTYSKPLIETGNFNVIGVYSDWKRSVHNTTVKWTETYVGITIIVDKASTLIEYIQLKNGSGEIATLVPYQTSTHYGREFRFFGSWYFLEPGYGNCSEYQWYVPGANEFFLPTYNPWPLGQEKPFGVRIKRK